MLADRVRGMTQKEKVFEDPFGTPGPPQTVAGDEEAGFFGEVSGGLLYTGNELIQSVRITQGTPQNSDTNWLKFVSNGKILFTPKKPILHSISFDYLESESVVYGEYYVQKDNFIYSLRLFQGGNNDPTDNINGPKNSEWNKLMLPINRDAPDSFKYNQNVSIPTEDWGIGYSDADLLTHYDYGNGSRTWCQDEPSFGSTDKVYRGGFGSSYSDAYSSAFAFARNGWRPVLELVKVVK